jgi:glutamate N-acetyltransferase / amino-acid N-acetyltransferase
VAGLSRTGSIDAREAIMTTDTMKKEVAVTLELGGAEVTIGAIAKGSGMIHPNMGTMLAFLTTDCAIAQPLLQEILAASVANTYNMISVDGDTSTNDMALFMSNGLAGNAPIEERGPDYRAFAEAVDEINVELAKLIARDGEGATKLAECVVSGAASEKDARALAKAVISSSLVKTALFGSDANWGRVLCALGYTEAAMDPAKVNLAFESGHGYLEVCRDGGPLPFNEEKAKRVLGDTEVSILVDLRMGEATATAWGCDLSYEYVRINGDYRK